MRVNRGKVVSINEAIRYQQHGLRPTFSTDDGVLMAVSGNEPCEKETQLELEAESAVAMRGAA